MTDLTFPKVKYKIRAHLKKIFTIKLLLNSCIIILVAPYLIHNM